MVTSCHCSLPLIHRVLVFSTSLGISSWVEVYPRTAKRGFNTPTARCLMKLSPPPVQLRSLLHVFFQLIMVYYTWPHFCQFFTSHVVPKYHMLPFLPVRWTCFFGLQPPRKALQTTGGWNASCHRLVDAYALPQWLAGLEGEGDAMEKMHRMA